MNTLPNNTEITAADIAEMLKKNLPPYLQAPLKEMMISGGREINRELLERVLDQKKGGRHIDPEDEAYLAKKVRSMNVAFNQLKLPYRINCDKSAKPRYELKRWTVKKHCSARTKNTEVISVQTPQLFELKGTPGYFVGKGIPNTLVGEGTYIARIVELTPNFIESTFECHETTELVIHVIKGELFFHHSDATETVMQPGSTRLIQKNERYRLSCKSGVVRFFSLTILALKK